MLNVTKELTALARKLGYTGKAPDTVAKAINAITASVGEGGGEGGGGVFKITATFDDSKNGYVLDKTYSQIKTAYDNGQLCVIRGEMNSEIEINTAPFGEIITITPLIYIEGDVLMYCVYLLDKQTEVVISTEYNYTLTPIS